MEYPDLVVPTRNFSRSKLHVHAQISTVFFFNYDPVHYLVVDFNS